MKKLMTSQIVLFILFTIIQTSAQDIVQSEFQASNKKVTTSENFVVKFQSLSDEALLIELSSDKMTWLKDGSPIAHLDIEPEGGDKVGEAIYHYFRAKNSKYSGMYIEDLRKMTISGRIDLYDTKAPIQIILLGKAGVSNSTTKVKIISGNLMTEKGSKINITDSIKNIHDELTVLFNDAASGFNETIEESLIYKRDEYIHYKNKNLITNKLGAYRSASVLKAADGSYAMRVMLSDYAEMMLSGRDEISESNQLIDALSTYSNDVFIISKLAEVEDVYTYLIETSEKAIGFIELRKIEDEWKVILVDVIDAVRLKKEIIEQLIILKNNPGLLKGELIDEKGEDYIFSKATATIYGASISQFLDNDFGYNCTRNNYMMYPMSGLHYIVRNLDIEMPGGEKLILNDGGDEYLGSSFAVLYQIDTGYYSVEISRYSSDSTKLQLTFYKY